MRYIPIISPLKQLSVKLGKSLYYSFKGLSYVVRHEHSFRLDIIFAFSTIVLGFVFRISISKWLVLSISILLLFISELINTVIELICDEILAIKSYSRPVELVKDIMSGAVFLSIFNLSIVSIFFFLIPLIKNGIVFFKT